MAKKFVIDVSFAQGTIDWETAKKHIDGAIIRCGFGDNISSQDDSQWARNISECERLGIPRGVYLYSYADSDAHAQSELQHLLRLLKGHTFQLPIYLDCEESYTASYAPRACEIICEGLKAAGYTPGVYANTSWWNNYLTNVTKYTRWVAQYNNVCTYNGSYDIWQFSSTGNVPGVHGNADVNYCYKEFSDLVKNSNSKPVAPPSSTPKTNKNFDAFYKVKTQKHGWLPEVKNLDDYAGYEESPITDIAIKVSGGSVKYRVHTINSGWLPYVTGYDTNDHNNGYAGVGTAIDAVEVYFYTPNGNIAKKAKYRVSACNRGYFDWQHDDEKGNGQDGYAGAFGVKIGRFQLCIE